jgi:HPt (histidine-containing phosphotransfer) domain-containing protein
MDGIETTRKLRDMGYAGVIVALTANAVAGNAGLFAQSGFDGFISKPIDVRHLNAALNKFVRDRHAEEAKRYARQPAETERSPGADSMLFSIFCRDAEKAVKVLRETAASGDIKLFTTTVHAMKSALANVGENEASGLASDLENAGLQNDIDFISSNTAPFIETLEALIRKFSPEEAGDATGGDVREDTAFLSEQLQIVKNACREYNDAAAYAALDRLKGQSWKPETAAALEEIRTMLFLHSDFEGAAERSDGLLR